MDQLDQHCALKETMKTAYNIELCEKFGSSYSTTILFYKKQALLPLLNECLYGRILYYLPHSKMYHMAYEARVGAP